MTADDLNRGLENVLVAETRLSSIDGEAGELVIGGFPLAELGANATYEETLFLLYEDRLPTPDELDAFRADLASLRAVPEATIDLLRAAAADDDQSPMDALRMGIAAASLGRDGGENPRRDALRAVAQTPTIVAAYWRLVRGDEPIDPEPELRHAADYLRMLTGETPTEEAARGIETYLNTVVDHGLNASTFTARVIVSTDSDVVSAVTGAVGALKGPLHGGAPGPVLDMIEAVADSGDSEGYVRERLAAGERVMGIGHRVYEVRDPRAAVLSDAAERFYDGQDAAFFVTARELEETAVEVLEAEKPGRRLAANVEFYTAVLLHGVGIPRDLFSPTFGVARVGGWTAHCLEQLEDNRLIRPRARYVGEDDRTWTSVEERA